jgi:HK97 family phage portal protein
MSLAAKLAGNRPRNLAPVPYVGRGGVGSIVLPSTGRGSRSDQLMTMSTIPTLFAVVNKLSTGVAAVEWSLYQQRGSAEPIPVTRHAALDLLLKPNDFMPWQEFAEVTQQHIDLTGEGWWVIVRHPSVASIPLEMWPIRPDRMEPVPDPGKFLLGYEYTSPGGQRIALELDQVIQIRMPNPMDIYRGLGPVQAMLVDLDSARYTSEWNRNFFKNSAEPGGIIKVDSRLSDTEFDEMQRRWNEQHKGVANAHRVAIIERAEWVDRKFTMRDLQFAELRKLTRDQILEGFGFPKVMLGATDGVNMANAVTAEYMFSKWLIKTRLDRIKGAIDNELIPLFGPAAEGVKWNYVNPVPVDEAAKNASLKIRIECFVLLLGVGADPVSAAEIAGIPEVTMKAITVGSAQSIPTNGHYRREVALP